MRSTDSGIVPLDELSNFSVHTLERIAVERCCLVYENGRTTVELGGVETVGLQKGVL